MTRQSNRGICREVEGERHGPAVTHGFNNLFTAIQANVPLAGMGLPAGHPALEFLEAAAGACQVNASVTARLMAMEKRGVAMRTVSMAQLVTEAAEFVCRETPSGIDLRIDPDLWTVAAYPEQIGQALHKILLNALEATPPGGRIEVSATNIICGATTLPPLLAGRYVRTTIEDHGSGIEPGILGQIFEPHFTTKQPGRGLGLTVARTIIAEHHGHIAVDSKPGHGTTFSVYLSASGTQSGVRSLAPTALPEGSGRILVMDDEEPLRALMRRLLEHRGYEVETVDEGVRAVAAFNAAKASGRGFDAVLLDLDIPGGMGGLEAALQIKAIDSSVRLIATSGRTDSLTITSEGHAFEDAIPKPWTPAQVSEVFDRVLRQAAPGAPGPRPVSDLAERRFEAAADSEVSRVRERLPLSPREGEIVRLVVQGYTNEEIAAKMFLTEQTVKNHLDTIFHKLRVSDRLELTLYAIRTREH